MKTKRLSLGKKLILSLLLLSISGQTFTMQNRLIQWAKAVFITACCFTPFMIAHLATKALSNSSQLTPYKPIEKNSINQTQRPYTDQELFFKAIAENNADEVKKLITDTTKKINVDELMPIRIGNISALHLCTKNKQLELMKILIENGKANVDINTGVSPLHVCAINGFAEEAELLLKNKAYVNNRSKINNNTPLHFCHGEEVANILINYGADLYALNNKKEIPVNSTYADTKAKELIARHTFPELIENKEKETKAPTKVKLSHATSDSIFHLNKEQLQKLEERAKL